MTKCKIRFRDLGKDERMPVLERMASGDGTLLMAFTDMLAQLDSAGLGGNCRDKAIRFAIEALADLSLERLAEVRKSLGLPSDAPVRRMAFEMAESVSDAYDKWEQAEIDKELMAIGLAA